MTLVSPTVDSPPGTPNYLVSVTAVLLFIGLTALFVIVGMTTWLGVRSEDYFAEIVRVRDYRSSVVELRSALQASETSQRGYLLTGNEIYLGPFGLEKGVAGRNVDFLSSKISPSSPQSFALTRLKIVVQEKFDEMDRTIELKRAGQDTDVLAIIKTNRGKRLTDEANVYFAGLLSYADQRLVAASYEQSQNFRFLQIASAAGGVVIVLVAAAAAFLVSRHTRSLAHSRDEVQALNSSLEDRVKERTIHLAQLNEEVRRFAYIVTHDLRAPLVNIMGFTREIEESVKMISPVVEPLAKSVAENHEGSRVRGAWAAVHFDIPEALSFIRGSAQRMDSLINAILKLSREGQRKLRFEALSLSALGRSTVAALQHNLADCGGTVSFDFATDEIVCDRLSLEQILSNLLDNAIKYRSPERLLNIAMGSRGSSSGGTIITVADNGRGIAGGDQERVFELFRRSGLQDQPGDGIGLAHVRTLVRNLGGEITLASELGRGTTFTIDLPLAEIEEERRIE